MKKAISTNKAPAAIGPYSQAVSVDERMIYTSGIIPIIPATGALLEGSVEEQTDLVLKNLKNLLESQQSSLDQVIKTTVFIKDMDDFQKINQVYAGYFNEPYPARSCVEVARLPKDVCIEIEAIALKG